MEYQAETSNDKEKKDSRYPQGHFDSLIKQVGAEYEIAYRHQLSRIQKRLTQLKLYYNQKRDPNAVGDTLLFSVFQTVLAQLYSDKLGVTFLGREQGDEETAENLTALAEFDFDKMELNKFNYFWLWDTLFFGHSIVRLEQFDRSEDKMCPVPELIDPVTFLYDPKASSVNGLMHGKGGMRFGGREISLTKSMMEEETGFFDYSDLKPSDDEVKSLMRQARDARNDATGQEVTTLSDETDMGDNALYSGLEWYTHWNGKKCMVVLANDRKRVIRYKEFEKRFPLIERILHPASNTWDSLSIPDIVEDFQRQRAITINLAIQSMKADLYPMYIYDEDRVKNKADLLKFGFNKFVGVQGNQGDIRGAVQPMNKATPRMDLVQFILDMLKTEAEEGTATPQTQQGQLSDQKRTLGELNLITSKSDTRYSLTASLFGWSDGDFWETWYMLYKTHFKEKIDEKMVRILGSFNMTWRTLTRENIIGKKDPDVKIESRIVSDNKKMKDRVMMNSFATTVLADPNAVGKLYFMRKVAKLNGLNKDEVAIVYPPTIDEMFAEQENEKLDKGEMLAVNPDDDDHVHMQVHSKAAETPEKLAHIRGHMANLMAKRMNPDLFVKKDPATGQPVAPPPGAGQASGAGANVRPPTPNLSATTPSGAANPTAQPYMNG